jgi:hypothetical protein
MAAMAEAAVEAREAVAVMARAAGITAAAPRVAALSRVAFGWRGQASFPALDGCPAVPAGKSARCLPF